MTSKFFELDCGEDEPVVMERREDGELIFHGWDRNAELAAIELGFEPSTCFLVWEAAKNNWLDDAMIKAVKKGKTAAVAALLAAGADVHAWDGVHEHDAALLWAADECHADIVKVLLEAGANVHALGDFALQQAADNGCLEIVQMLLEAGANVNADNSLALDWAAEEGHLAVVELLLQAGARVSAAALEAAQKNEHAAIAGLLEKKFVEQP
jgi:ankyrin repeat protein